MPNPSQAAGEDAGPFEQLDLEDVDLLLAVRSATVALLSDRRPMRLLKLYGYEDA